MMTVNGQTTLAWSHS